MGMQLYQQDNARREARKAQEDQRRREQFNNMMRVVGGGMPSVGGAQEALPQVNYGGAVSTIGGMVDSAQTQQEAQDYRTAQDARVDSRWQNDYNLRVEAANNAAYEREQALQNAREKASWEANPQNPDNQYKNAQLGLVEAQREKILEDLKKTGEKEPTMTPTQAWGVIKDMQGSADSADPMKLAMAQMVAKSQGLPVPTQTPVKKYEVPDNVAFSVEKALGMEPTYVNVNEDAGQVTGLPDYLRPKKRVPNPKVFGRGRGENRLGLNL
jgi:hypothetical protein